MIRDFQKNDSIAITEIYNYYVLNSIITFDHTPYSVANYYAKIKRINDHFPCIVYEENKVVIGFAYASQWRQKPAYDQTVESTVYLKHGMERNGIGTLLYSELLDRLKAKNIHAVIGGISLPNDASVVFHEKFGFEKVAHFKEVGRKFGKWIDVGFWQLNFVFNEH